MGMSRLRIVREAPIDERVVEYMSVHAFDVFQRAEYFDTLDEALGDSVYSAGVTRRRGKKRKTVSLLPEEMAESASRVKQGSVALVFGNERTGLTDEELSLCSIAVHIPSSAVFPSLNLSHAVQILTYAFCRHEHASPRYTPVPRERIDSLTKRSIDSLNAVGFFTPAGDSIMTEFLHDIYTRALLSNTDADRVEKKFAKIANLILHRSDCRGASCIPPRMPDHAPSPSRPREWYDFCFTF